MIVSDRDDELFVTDGRVVSRGGGSDAGDVGCAVARGRRRRRADRCRGERRAGRSWSRPASTTAVESRLRDRLMGIVAVAGDAVHHDLRRAGSGVAGQRRRDPRRGRPVRWRPRGLVRHAGLAVAVDRRHHGASTAPGPRSNDTPGSPTSGLRRAPGAGRRGRSAAGGGRVGPLAVTTTLATLRSPVAIVDTGRARPPTRIRSSQSAGVDRRGPPPGPAVGPSRSRPAATARRSDRVLRRCSVDLVDRRGRRCLTIRHRRDRVVPERHRSASAPLVGLPVDELAAAVLGGRDGRVRPPARPAAADEGGARPRASVAERGAGPRAASWAVEGRADERRVDRRIDDDRGALVRYVTDRVASRLVEAIEIDEASQPRRMVRRSGAARHRQPSPTAPGRRLAERRDRDRQPGPDASRRAPARPRSSTATSGRGSSPNSRAPARSSRSCPTRCRGDRRQLPPVDLGHLQRRPQGRRRGAVGVVDRSHRLPEAPGAADDRHRARVASTRSRRCSRSRPTTARACVMVLGGRGEHGISTHPRIAIRRFVLRHEGLDGLARRGLFPSDARAAACRR